MKKVSSYKCKTCGQKFKSLKVWGNHLDREHPGELPKDFSYARYYYFLLTGKMEGKCIVCGRATKWNEATQKYARFCELEECKTSYREMFKKRMIGKHGKVHLLDDPEYQRTKMLANKKTHGIYDFKTDGVRVEFHSTYELDFLKMLDRFLAFKGADIMSPSPHTYYYEYEGKKKFYIPDFYIPSANLEIEIKQTTNKHPKIATVDAEKTRLKDEMMNNQPNVRYFKIEDKTYVEFFKYLQNLDPMESLELKALEANTTSDHNKKAKIKLSSLKKITFDYNSIDLMKSEYKAKLKVSNPKELPLTSYGDNGEIYLNDKGKYIGHILLEPQGKAMWVKEIYVDEKFRNQGLAKQIITRGIRKLNVTNTVINVNLDYVIDLCKKLGFNEYTRDDNYIYLAI